MNEFETVSHLMMLDHISYEELANKLGQADPSNLYKTINKHKNIYVSSIRKILDALGYEMVFRKKGKDTGGYIIKDDEEVSPLRFHDMNLDFEIIFGDKLNTHKSKLPVLTIGQANLASQLLKKKVPELTFSECDKELREIWNIKDKIKGRRQPQNEYMQEYMKYRKEFEDLYRR